MRAILLFAAVTCAAGARADETQSSRQQEGKRLFEATCNYCHNPRGWATERLRTRLPESKVVLAQRTDLDPKYIRFVVRSGLVNMPAYTPTDLSDAQIELVAEYLMRK